MYFVLLLGIVLVGGLFGGLYTHEAISAIGSGTTTDQASLFFSPEGAILVVGGLALMVPAIAFALWTSRERPFGTLMSVFGSPRFRMFAKALAFAFVTLSVPIFLEIGLASGWAVPAPHPMEVPTWILVTLAIVLPLQCIAEEVVFRGYAMQTIASWMPEKVALPIAIVAQAILFMMGHAYDLPGQLSILMSGLIWGWVAEKTGGLETSIAFHIANNTLAFLVMGLGLASITNDVPVVEAVIDGAFSTLMPALFIAWGTRRGWIGDEETIRAGHEPCRMFGSQSDAIMWERIQQEQLEDWNRFVSQMPAVDSFGSQPMPYSEGQYDGEGYIDGEGMVIGVGDEQYDDNQIVSVMDTEFRVPTQDSLPIGEQVANRQPAPQPSEKQGVYQDEFPHAPGTGFPYAESAPASAPPVGIPVASQPQTTLPDHGPMAWEEPDEMIPLSDGGQQEPGSASPYFPTDSIPDLNSLL